MKSFHILIRSDYGDDGSHIKSDVVLVREESPDRGLILVDVALPQVKAETYEYLEDKIIEVLRTYGLSGHIEDLATGNSMVV